MSVCGAGRGGAGAIAGAGLCRDHRRARPRDADRQTDQRRDPVKLLAFTGVKTGMTVLDMGAGGGYSTELMARAVGPSGKVYGQDSETSARAKERFEARMKTDAMKNVVALARPFDDPLPAEVSDLDLITFFFFYHDTTYMAVDRAAMNKKLFAALKPGGIPGDRRSFGQAGAGTSVGKTLHRIEESVLQSEVEAAGFKLVGERRFPAPPGGPARRADLPAQGAGGRVRAEIPEAELRKVRILPKREGSEIKSRSPPPSTSLPPSSLPAPRDAPRRAS